MKNQNSTVLSILKYEYIKYTEYIKRHRNKQVVRFAIRNVGFCTSVYAIKGVLLSWGRERIKNRFNNSDLLNAYP